MGRCQEFRESSTLLTYDRVASALNGITHIHSKFNALRRVINAYAKQHEVIDSNTAKSSPIHYSQGMFHGFLGYREFNRNDSDAEDESKSFAIVHDNDCRGKVPQTKDWELSIVQEALTSPAVIVEDDVGAIVSVVRQY